MCPVTLETTMSEPDNRHDQRRRQTRQALVEAYSALVLEGPDGPIQVMDIVRRAQVGRSTFYEHFDNADAVQREAIAGPLRWLSDAISGQGRREDLLQLLEHLQENRQQATLALEGRQRRLAAGVVVEQVMNTLQGQGRAPERLAVVQVAEGSLALMHAWLRGEIRNPAGELAQAIMDSSRALLALREKGGSAAAGFEEQ